VICLDSSNRQLQRLDLVYRQLVGRREEIDRVCSTIRSRRANAVFLVGGPGLGKSTLTEAISKRLSSDMATLRVHGSSSLATVPFGVLAPYTTGLSSEDALSPVAVLRAVWEHCEKLKAGKQGPILLVVDDAHQLDDGTAGILVEMVAAGWAAVLAASRVRPGLPPVLNQLWYDGLAERIDLRPLSREQVAEAVSQALEGIVPANTVQHLWAASGGNPLLLDCLLQDAIQAGVLVKRHGIWLLSGELTVDGPKLTDVVATHLFRRSAEEQDALKLIALAEPVQRSVIEEVSGAAVVRSLLEQQLVSESNTGHSHLRLWQPVFAEAIRKHVSVSRSLQLRQKLQGHPGAEPVGDEGRLRMTAWSVECGLTVPDQELLDGALLSVSMFKNGMARHMASRIRDPDLLPRAKAVAARAFFNEGRYEEAAQLLDDCWLALAEEPGAGHVLMLRAAAHLAVGQPAGQLRAEAERELSSAAPLGAGAKRGRTSGSSAASWQGALYPLLELAEAGDSDAIRDLLASAEASEGTPAGTALPAVGRALLSEALVADGRLEAALAAAEEAQRAVPEAEPGLFFFSEFVLARRVLAHLADGDWESAERELSQYGSGATEPASAFDGSFQALEGFSLLRQGRLDEAYRVLLPALEALRVSDPLQQFRLCAALAFYAAARLNDGEQAKRLQQDYRISGHAETAPARLEAAAYAAAAREHLEHDHFGLDELHALAGEAEGQSLRGVELDILALCVELGDQTALSRAGAVAASVEGRWAAGWQVLAHAWASGRPDALLEAARSLQEAGLINLARDAYAKAAAILQSSGERRRARQAAALREKCDQELGERSKDGASAPSAPAVRLTKRERDIVELAVQGYSDREIAQQLMVSVRTVEGHLYRSYVKLGVRRRDELATAIPKK
jgi:DNA-binding CsgD family transcriptional regulator